MKILIMITLCVFITFSLTGCEMTDEQKAEVAKQNKENVKLYEQIKVLREKLKSGELTVLEFEQAYKSVRAQIDSNLDTIGAIQGAGVSTWEVVGYSALNLVMLIFGRGLPSKGPLSFIRAWAGGTVRDKKKAKSG